MRGNPPCSAVIHSWQPSFTSDNVFCSECGHIVFIKARDFVRAVDRHRRKLETRYRPRPNSKTVKRKRARLLIRDGPFCHWCKAEFGDHNLPTLEHIIRIADGGSNHWDNLALACGPCNWNRHRRERSEEVA